VRLWGIDAVESSQTCLDAAGPLGDGRYAIVAGERRYRAAKMAGLAEVPVRVLDLPEKEARLLAQVATRLARLDPESLPPEKRRAVEEKVRELLALLGGEE